jgi:cell division transport system permease protein
MNNISQVGNKTYGVFMSHKENIKSSLLKLVQKPASSLLTILVIAVAITIPTTLWQIIKNAKIIGQNWDGKTKISCFLTKNTQFNTANKLAQQLSRQAPITKTVIKTPDEALSEFKELTDFDEVLDVLDTNPLPFVIIVTPAKDLTSKQIAQLSQQLEQLPQIESALIDLAWLKKLMAFIEVLSTAMIILMLLLFIAVILVIGNTIRLEVQNRQSQIQVMNLVGASPAFIKRPFLYTGFWLGLFGGILSWLFTFISLHMLKKPVVYFSSLYANEFNLQHLEIQNAIMLIVCIAFLGWIGALISASLVLKKMQKPYE